MLDYIIIILFHQLMVRTSVPVSPTRKMNRTKMIPTAKFHNFVLQNFCIMFTETEIFPILYFVSI